MRRRPASLLALERGMLRARAASLPQVWWSAIPFDYGNNDPGTQMQREVVADMAADPTQNVTVVLPQTADSLPRSIGGPPLVYDPTTGIWSGGDPLHRDIPDNQRFGMLAAPLVARASWRPRAATRISAIPAGVPAMGGPVVSHVYRQSNTVLVVTVQHDGGTDLIVPATQAARGIGLGGDGWRLRRRRPGRSSTATACARLNADAVADHAGAGPGQCQSACRRCSTHMEPPRSGAAMRSPTIWHRYAPGRMERRGRPRNTWSLNMPVHVPMTHRRASC